MAADGAPANGTPNALESIVDEMLTTLIDLAAKVSELATQTAALKPLLLLAKQLDGLPKKVTKLQAAAFEGSNQIAALNLTVACLECTQCGDNEPTREDEAEGDASEHGLSKDTFTSPSSPTPFREMPPLRLQNFDDEAADPRFHPCARIEFPTFDGKEDPLPWLNCYETFFRCHNTQERRCVPYASLHLTGTAQLWFYRLELT